MKKEYSFYDLWQLFKKYFIRILNMTIIGATLAAIVVMFFVEPQYSSQAQLIVNQRSNQDTSIQYNEVQTNVTLVSTYRDIILGDGVVEGGTGVKAGQASQTSNSKAEEIVK